MRQKWLDVMAAISLARSKHGAGVFARRRRLPALPRSRRPQDTEVRSVEATAQEIIHCFGLNIAQRSEAPLPACLMMRQIAIKKSACLKRQA